MGVIFSKKIKNIIIKNREKKKKRKMKRKMKRKKTHNIAKYRARKYTQNTYPLNTKPVQVKFIGYNGYDTPAIPKFSYIYKGVPGGFYI
tara:strand:+ start:134 stop:400 length:267 start_codon:yes stop_codon:yes gene_type:complete